jgi:hypothetical protein
MSFLTNCNNYFRKDKPESILSVGFLLCLLVFCFITIYQCLKGIPVNWLGAAAYITALFSFKTAHSYISNSFNPQYDENANSPINPVQPPDISQLPNTKTM